MISLIVIFLSWNVMSMLWLSDRNMRCIVDNSSISESEVILYFSVMFQLSTFKSKLLFNTKALCLNNIYNFIKK